MALVKKTIQNIVLPLKPEFDACQRIFINDIFGQDMLDDEKIIAQFDEEGNDTVKPVECDGIAIDRENACLRIAGGKAVSFSTYLNSCSVKKWDKLTAVQSFDLVLDIEGSIDLVIDEFSMPDITAPGKQPACEKAFRLEQWDALRIDCPERMEIAIPLGPVGCNVVGFEVTAIGDCTIHGGRYEAAIDEDDLVDVDLVLSTTTFKKEEYITRNIHLLEDEIFAADEEMKDHFRVFVVDNGQTLDPAEFTNDHLTVFPNINGGGAGGFSRGMIEALRAEKRPTHILLMDDDVFILSESLKRTYALLTMLKPEYRDLYISGAMLELEYMHRMHEDVGFLHTDGYYSSKKGQKRDMCNMKFITENEVDWADWGHEYAAWWYCCIPMVHVSEHDLPTPFFVRCDDVEYGLRHNDKGFITLNGICVWHNGFGKKFSGSMELYQVIRNSMILQAVTGTCDDVNFYGRICWAFRIMLSKYAYNYAELLLDALEDYLVGPDIISHPNGVDFIRAKGQLNEKMRPIEEFGPEAVALAKNKKRLHKAPGVNKRRFYDRTWNGFKFPDFMTRDELGVVPYDNIDSVGDYLFKRRILAVDSLNGEAAMREYDKAEFERIHGRAVELFARYEREKSVVAARYRAARDRFRSIEFWKEYLGID